LYNTRTDLVRFGARDYSPETGRWTAEDPIGFWIGDINFYAYVANDPVNFVDPSGLSKSGGLLTAGCTPSISAVHGNSLNSLRPTWGYKLYSSKYGIFF
jgi:RHS repeat-associated protein